MEASHVFLCEAVVRFSVRVNFEDGSVKTKKVCFEKHT